MKISGIFMVLFFGVGITFAQPGMRQGMDPDGGDSRRFQEREASREAHEIRHHGQELWMNLMLHDELGLTQMQRESLMEFLDDSSNGMKASIAQRIRLQDRLVEAFRSSVVDEDLLKKIQADWLASESIWLQHRMKATQFFFSILSMDQKLRFWDIHEKRKVDREKEKGDQKRPPRKKEHRLR